MKLSWHRGPDPMKDAWGPSGAPPWARDYEIVPTASLAQAEQEMRAAAPVEGTEAPAWLQTPKPLAWAPPALRQEFTLPHAVGS